MAWAALAYTTAKSRRIRAAVEQKGDARRHYRLQYQGEAIRAYLAKRFADGRAEEFRWLGRRPDR